MSTIWDRAVRAVGRTLPDHHRRTDPFAGYYCGGDETGARCEHLECWIVAQLANEDLLNYPEPDPAEVARYLGHRAPLALVPDPDPAG